MTVKPPIFSSRRAFGVPQDRRHNRRIVFVEGGVENFCLDSHGEKEIPPLRRPRALGARPTKERWGRRRPANACAECRWPRKRVAE